MPALDGLDGARSIARCEVAVVEREEDRALVEQARRALLDQRCGFLGEHPGGLAVARALLGLGPHAERDREDIAVAGGAVRFGGGLEERARALGSLRIARREPLAPAVEENAERRRDRARPTRCRGRVGVGSRGSASSLSSAGSAPNVAVQPSRFIRPWRMAPVLPMACARASPDVDRFAGLANVRRWW